MAERCGERRVLHPAPVDEQRLPVARHAREFGHAEPCLEREPRTLLAHLDHAVGERGAVEPDESLAPRRGLGQREPRLAVDREAERRRRVGERVGREHAQRDAQLGRGGAQDGVLQGLLGRPPITIDRFLEEFAGDFRGHSVNA